MHTDFAEDAGKNDQYVTLDQQHDSHNELHKRLYAHAEHEGKVGYILVCRVLLGHSIRTQETGRGAKSMDSGLPIFPIGFRELRTVDGVSPPVFHHSLVAEVRRVCFGSLTGTEIFRLHMPPIVGIRCYPPTTTFSFIMKPPLQGTPRLPWQLGPMINRYREFIVFHGEYIYPEYVIAYQRFHNQHGPVG